MRQHQFSINAADVSLNLRRVLLTLLIISLDDACNIKDIISINLVFVLLLRIQLADFVRLQAVVSRSPSLRLGLVVSQGIQRLFGGQFLHLESLAYCFQSVLGLDLLDAQRQFE